MKRRFVVFGAILLGTLLLDQVTKIWVAAALQHHCEPLGHSGITLERCDPRETIVRLPQPARQLTLRAGRRSPIVLRCDQDRPCLTGVINLAVPPAGARWSTAPGRLRRGGIYAISIENDTLRMTYEKPAPMRSVIDGFLGVEYAENPGAAFSFLRDRPGLRRPLLIAVALIALVLLGWMTYRLRADQRLQRVALALVIAGALGNLIDRIRLSYVIDFVVVYYKDKFRWPTFNVADVAIIVGVGLLLLGNVRGWFRRNQDKTKAAPSGGT